MARIRPTAESSKHDARFRHVVFAQTKSDSNIVKTRRINLTSRIKTTRVIKIDTSSADISEVIIRAGVCSSTSILLMIDTLKNHFTYVEVYCQQMANVNLVTFLSGSALNHIEINIHLLGYSANANVGIACLPNQTGAAVVHSLQNHNDRLTTSNLECRAVLADETRVHYHGLITVSKNGSGTDAYQKNANVLLSNRAKAYSVPKLEIEASDVRCTHGSTTAGLSEDDLFYVQSRGLMPTISKRLISQAYLVTVAKSLNDPKLERVFNRLVTSQIARVIK